jgi:competence protein ComGC
MNHLISPILVALAWTPAHAAIQTGSKPSKPSSNGETAFSRIELMTILGGVSILLLIVLPALAHDRARSSRIQCANNLRQIGIGFALWGNDHGNEPPHHVMFQDGGTRRHPLAANAWLHFSWISNEVATPKIFFCPSDTGNPAHDFTSSPASGYVHPNFANRATSYFLTFTYYGDDRIQVGDRNIYTSGEFIGQSYFNYARTIRVLPINPAFRWLPGLHEEVGNLLFNDGQVEMTDSARLREAAEGGNDLFGAGGTTMKFCIPR